MSYITVEVELDDFDDEDLKEELESRGFHVSEESTASWDEAKELQTAYLAHHNGDKDKAYEILWRMCLEKLNKVV